MEQIKNLRQVVATAHVWASASTCASRTVGAVVVNKEGRVLATGYNGTSIKCHCNDRFRKLNDEVYMMRKDEGYVWHVVYKEEWKLKHHEFQLKYETHAEMNAVVNMLKTNSSIDDNMTLVCTLEPCSNCAKLIIATGIKHVLYVEEYARDHETTADIFKEAGIDFARIELQD